jgi:methylenetetrahydrofolate dehydrogenase (NADP+)/methenyltetrahydrofolate cyclohydrolase
MPHVFQKLDGKLVSERVMAELKLSVDQFTKNWKRSPSLDVVLVGENPASQIYVGHKEKAASKLGFTSKIHRLPPTVTQADLESVVQNLVLDQQVDGILVQMPLPAHLDSQKIIEIIPFEKDVDGFSEKSVGALCLGRPKAVACTPAGVMELLKFYQISVTGLHAVVVGRSSIVGKPMAMLLINAGATVTVCHSKTVNLKSHLKLADLVVVAAGQPEFLKASDFNQNSIVIDVGIHRNEKQKIVGDVDPLGLDLVAKAATPVPGGVGPMTIAMLLSNTLSLANYRMENL